MADLTFVLPGDYRSGGVRVTVLMANLLLGRGHSVRIAYPRGRLLSRAGLKRLVSGRNPNANAGWLHQFKGELVTYRQLDELNYAPGEIVIAVGTYMVADVRAMTKPVIKVRFNHGFPAKPDAAQDAAWRGRMPTITVSNTLVPRLQEQTEGSVWGVVPNGIDLTEYFPEPEIPRDGIGALFNPHSNKAPEDLIAVLQTCHERWPGTPQRVFGAERRPAGLEHVEYTQLPEVDLAREIYNRSLTWLLTSRTEGLPGVVLEALACHCVVVSSDNEGSKEILVHEQNGLLVPRGDRAGFVEAIGRVLASDELRCRLVAGAAETIRNFSWERAADRMEEFLRAAPNLSQANPAISQP
jgi:L-malate glycosyltransferase